VTPDSSFNEAIKKFEERASLPKDFVWRMMDDDDWSFVIKLHACFEASLSWMINVELRRSELAAFVSKLPMHGEQSSKIAIARTLNLIDKRDIPFLQWFSELRNRLVHRIENIGFTFKEEFTPFDKPASSAAIKHLFRSHWDATISMQEFRDLFANDPKYVVWATGVSALAVFEVTSETMDLKHQTKRHQDHISLLQSLVETVKR
jgi:hypothetical protein